MRSARKPTPIYSVLVDLRHVDHIAIGINEKYLNTTCKPSQVILGLGVRCPTQLTRSSSKDSHCLHVEGGVIAILLECLITGIAVKVRHYSSPPHKPCMTENQRRRGISSSQLNPSE